MCDAYYTQNQLEAFTSINHFKTRKKLIFAENYVQIMKIGKNSIISRLFENTFYLSLSLSLV